jgi:hypothetical protein
MDEVEQDTSGFMPIIGIAEVSQHLFASFIFR